MVKIITNKTFNFTSSSIKSCEQYFDFLKSFNFIMNTIVVGTYTLFRDCIYLQSLISLLELNYAINWMGTVELTSSDPTHTLSRLNCLPCM